MIHFLTVHHIDQYKAANSLLELLNEDLIVDHIKPANLTLLQTSKITHVSMPIGNSPTIINPFSVLFKRSVTDLCRCIHLMNLHLNMRCLNVVGGISISKSIRSGSLNGTFR